MDLTQRLGEVAQAARADADARDTDAVARASEAVAGLTDRLLVVQRETAGAVEAAAATLARRAHELDAAASALPDELTVTFRRLVEDTVSTSLAGAREQADRVRTDLEEAVAQATGRVEALLTSLEDRLTALESRLLETGAAVTRDVELTAQGLNTVGSNVLDRLLDLLDERDARDKQLEDRMTARVDRLTKKTADRVAEITAVLDEQVALLDERDLAERAYVTEVLQDVVERLLAEPRSKLRDLRR